MKKILKKYLFYFILAAIIAVSCDELPCSNEDGVLLDVGFYKMENGALKDTTIDSIIFYPVNQEEIYYNGIDSNVTSVDLPLDVSCDTTNYVVLFDSILYDTISLIYTRELVLESHDCGFVQNYYLKEVDYTQNRIDSAWIRRELVDYNEDEDIKISF